MTARHDLHRATAPLVALCIPSGDLVHKHFAMCLGGLMSASSSGRDFPAKHIALIGTEGSLIVNNRNLLVSQAKRVGADWLMFLDADMTFPAFALHRLLSHGVDIVGCTYLRRVQPFQPIGLWAPGTELRTDRLTEVLGLPAGCMLIRMSVFDKLREPYFRTPAFEAEDGKPARTQGEDYYFCESARAAGFKVWLDAALSTELGHIGCFEHRLQFSSDPQEAGHGQATH